MTIEINKPELEALIIEQMTTGKFQSIEDVLMQALKALPISDEAPGEQHEGRTGADLIAAMQASPYREIEIEPASYRLPVRDVVF